MGDNVCLLWIGYCLIIDNDMSICLIFCELVEPPDGERESEPDGDRVDHDGEVGVEQHEETPRGRKLRIDLD